MDKGLISNIQHYSLQDGPGIRTTVFLKGCPMRCLWCCNPETQHDYPETMGEKTVGKWMSVSEILAEVEKDEVFYRHGAGGLTVSGGEPLYQGEFVLSLLTEAKRQHLATAMESSACGDGELLSRMAMLSETIYLDIKSLDSEKHLEWTGVRNEQILQNIRRVSEMKMRGHLVIRTPVIPGFNNCVSDISEIRRFVEELPGNVSYELLEYHRFGKDKYRLLGRPYPMGSARLDTEEWNRLKDAVF